MPKNKPCCDAPCNPESITDEDVLAVLHSMKLSQKGNLWKKYFDGTVVTVFSDHHQHGYRVCVHEDGQPHYSRNTYASEYAAVEAYLRYRDGECLL